MGISMRGVHAGVFQGEPRFRPKDTEPISDPPIAFHLALLGRRERSFLGFAGNLLHPRLVLGTELDTQNFARLQERNRCGQACQACRRWRRRLLEYVFVAYTSICVNASSFTLPRAFR